jgi:hypothetical protein
MPTEEETGWATDRLGAVKQKEIILSRELNPGLFVPFPVSVPTDLPSQPM